MCLVKVRQEEEIEVPYRRTTVVRTRSTSPRRRASRRVSRHEVIRESRPASSSFVAVAPRPQSASYVAIPAPVQAPIPAPQPVPLFVQPPPPAPSHVSSSHHHHTAHYVEVNPRSSVTTSSSSSRGDYVVHEREYRRERRDYSPSPVRYETYRYVDAGPAEPDHYERFQRRERSRSRARSLSRDYAYDPRDSYRETRERIVISDSDGRRRTSEYRR
ncbi:hypothetical protein M011DRAFT_492729 [Sporormia fimetaria CBS 119925]|uniref:Uncharacterized protein n=1 Tax=Sporormia fimetaria CBS 119925 TaxID=1340428 RepID=A0A6A6VKI8_9PLEO|nr:hypothetical protein M011DRAFT_492729 [Sporormia fimetaria CBS 119925]